MFEYVLTDIDRHFSDFLHNEADSPSPHLKLLSSVLSSAVGVGHICLNLGELAGQKVRIDGREIDLPEYGELRESLLSSSVVGAPGDYRPLVLDRAGRLYLHRYWQYEQDLARILLDKARSAGEGLDEETLKAGLARLFPADPSSEIDWQRVAALAAVRKKFCVISGGPGTGKTSTVVKILALLLEQVAGRPFRIALAAPTGKSAARLKESISRMKADLDCAEAVREQIPHDVSTIHRLLGSKGSPVRFRFNRENLLPYDAVIVDEASMVPLPMMAKLAEALKGGARLVLLGDRDQLASVEAGAVLSDICGGKRDEPFSREFHDLFTGMGEGCQEVLKVSENHLPPLTDALVVLKKNYRFGGATGIGALGQAVNAGDGAAALSLLGDPGRPEIGWRKVPQVDGLKRALADIVVEGYGGYIAATSAEEALRRFDSFRILCALRQGPYGVSGVNGLVEDILSDAGLIDPRSRWYHGRPVMVTVNDYNLKLFNGDVGILFREKDSADPPRACFPAPDGGIRTVPTVRLPNHETVFAMTVHKSQGSEFDRVLLLLPSHDFEGFTRELIYTGITRTKTAVEIWGEERVFSEAVSRRVDRKSGLEDALWEGPRN